MTDVEIAERRLEIVKLRNLAKWQREDYAASHLRQAEHPIYTGQEAVCARKAAQAARLASENDARADVMEARLLEEMAR